MLHNGLTNKSEDVFSSWPIELQSTPEHLGIFSSFFVNGKATLLNGLIQMGQHSLY